MPLIQKAFSLDDVPTAALICLDRDWSEFSDESSQNPAVITRAGDLAYVSFTSGSTGQPKGVCVPHRGVVRLVRNTTYAKFSTADIVLQLAPVSFDASTWEIWGCLLNGGRLVIFPPYTPSLTELSSAIQNHRITMMWLTSGLFNQVVDEVPECLKSLRQLLTGGDVLSVPHVRKALSLLGEKCQLVNGYGPTENTTFTTCHPIRPGFDDGRAILIGKPISNTQCYVVDKRFQPVPIGVPGELLAGGDGLALGYLNRPELTEERFIPHPFSNEPGARVYRTGDMVRYRADGNLEFLGRVDLQVKIRGFRIELGEIESVLSRHAGGGSLRGDGPRGSDGDEALGGVCGGTNSGRQGKWRIAPLPKREVARSYMLPSVFVFLDTLPLTANGKVDRGALPSPDQGRPEMEIKYVEPGDVLEQEVAKVWEEVLGVQPIGMEDKFFELGGHSLLAVRLLARVEKEFGRKLPLAVVFQAPTIAQMARLLRDGEELAPGSSLVEIQPKGSRPPLFFVHGVGGGMFWGYTNLSRSLGQDQPVYALKSRWIGWPGGVRQVSRTWQRSMCRDIRTVAARWTISSRRLLFRRERRLRDGSATRGSRGESRAAGGAQLCPAELQLWETELEPIFPV